MSKWLNFYQALPLLMKEYLNEIIGELSDFTLMKRLYGDSILFVSESTNIEVSISIDSCGSLLAIWFPDQQDPSYTEHQIFVG